MTIAELKELHGTDGNEACHAFWNECGAELLALWEALNEWERLRKIAGKPIEAKSYEGGLMTLSSHIREAEWAVRPLLDALNVKATTMVV